jgi:hypothetical protein
MVAFNSISIIEPDSVDRRIGDAMNGKLFQHSQTQKKGFAKRTESAHLAAEVRVGTPSLA